MKKAVALDDGAVAHELDGSPLEALRALRRQVDVLGEAELVVLSTHIQERLEQLWATQRAKRRRE